MAAVPAVMMEEQYLFMSSGLRSRAPKREECRLVDVPERRRARNVVWFTFQSARGRGMSSTLRSRAREGEKCRRLVYVPERRRHFSLSGALERKLDDISRPPALWNVN